MGKKRITTSGGDTNAGENKAAVSSKRKLAQGILAISATYNNTKIVLTDPSGNAVASSSSGSLGFKGAKKGTPFAAGKVAELLADKATAMGLKEVDILVKGVGAGRESAIRAFTARGFVVNSIKDSTPVPFNGPKPPKPRRV
jgi:small subunit ribosomal protein S11